MVVRLAFTVTLGLTLAACTDQEEPAPDEPPPAEAVEPSPAGLQVGVVLAVDDGNDTTGVDELRGRLEDLATERDTDVASLRVVVPDGAGFAVDVAALLAEDGHDLVCVLGEVPTTSVIDLADRFPATRFCAGAQERDEVPDNIQLLDIAHEELGYALGVLAAELADGDPVALVAADDAGDRGRRRAGLTGGLGGAPLAVFPVPLANGEPDLDALTGRLEERDDDEPFGAYLLDVPPALLGPLTEALVDAPILAPGRGADDLPAVVVRYRVDVAALVARALDRLIEGEPADAGQVGFAHAAFEIELSGPGTALQQQLDAVRERIVAGIVDLPGDPDDPAEVEGPEDPEDLEDAPTAAP